MQANTETARNFSLRPSLPNQLHHQASLLLKTFSCFQSIQIDPLKAIPPFPLTPIPCHTSDPHPLTLGPSLLTQQKHLLSWRRRLGWLIQQVGNVGPTAHV